MARGGVLARFYRPEDRDFELLFCPGGWGIRPSKNLPGAFARGGMVRLGID